MPRDMFGDVVDPSIKVGTSQRYTVPFSIAVHSIVILALLVIPLLATNAIPTPASVLAFATLPPAVPPPPPPPPPPAPPTPQIVAPPNPVAAPVVAPAEIRPEPPPPSFNMGGVVGGVPGGIPGGVPGGVVGGIQAPPPPPPAALPPQRVGGAIKDPQRLKYVEPKYPPAAMAAKISGYVIIEATIATDGTVKDAKILRPMALLDQAALEAVKQWRYTPTLLNGVPVEVLLIVTVNFNLK